LCVLGQTGQTTGVVRTGVLVNNLLIRVAGVTPIIYFSGMDNNIPENFFELTLSQQGANWLLRLYKITRWLIIMGIVLFLLGFINIILQYNLYLQYKTPNNWLEIVQTRIYPAFEGVALIITIVQLYYYFTFTRICKEAIEQQQSELFNNAFKWLLRNTLTACVMFVMHFIGTSFVLYNQFVLLSSLH
jgi:hypothetical protein